MTSHGNSEEILRTVRFCCALALLPTHLLQRGLESILLALLDLNDAVIFGAVYPFLNYVQNEWINHANRGRCMSVCESDHRTNNASSTFQTVLRILEQYNNRRMKREIRSSHPNIFLFIRHLVNFEDSTIDDLWSLSRGEVPARHRPVRSVYADVSIRRITNQLMANNNPSYEDLLRFLAAAENSVERIVNEALDNQNY
ncbi:30S ribosomal protein S7-1 [Frankliniella fusca]|uniref:30S ribosomal protein S7-1 n=1 Tax=Frankliniella fusca TaxID=407009 RepID=A0AAE1I218_9NEOP|nr:30S ribosomal protein S7-1 [Frankliniella fusca]